MTTEPTSCPPPPPLRLRPLPASEDSRCHYPDADNAPVAAYAQGTLALDFRLASGVPAVPTTPSLTLLPGGRSSSSTPPGLPNVREWAARFVQAIAEVIGGDRPVAQLIRWTDADVFLDMSRRVRILGVTSTAATRSKVNRPQVRSVHVCQPSDGIAEVAVHILQGARSRAVAARLEVVRGRWLCTALELA
jgi:hypothetical protein